jgi:hypothetical protein
MPFGKVLSWHGIAFGGADRAIHPDYSEQPSRNQAKD